MTAYSSLTDDPLLKEAPILEGYKIIGPVVLYSKLGQGGMGAVYKGRHTRLNIDVVVKIMLAPIGLSQTLKEQYVKRFIREASIAANIVHQNLVHVSDVNTQNGLYYLTMEYVNGESAAERLKRKGRLPEREALEIILGAADGLAEAHEKGIIHRDIKPANIMITTEGKIKVADLGLAKAVGAESVDVISMMTLPQETLGTPHYMSPEQIESNNNVSYRSDVWSLGVTLYQLLTNLVPWDDTVLRKLLNKICEEEPTDIRTRCELISDATYDLIQKCLSKTVADRFINCGEMSKAIRKTLLSLPVDKSKLATSVILDLKADSIKNKNVIAAPDNDVIKKIAKKLNVDKAVDYIASDKDAMAVFNTRTEAPTADAQLAIQGSISSRKLKCPICGRRNDVDDTFECVKCARDYLCIEHYNKIERCCEQCAEQEAIKEKSVIENAAMKVELFKRAENTRKNEASLPIIDLGNGVLMEYVLIPAGDFMMGSNERIGENPVHRVEFVKPFYMSKYQVTQEQYEQITGMNPSHFKGLRYPVEQVSWNSAKEFCILLSQRMGFSFSLPTEAQWEYACRAGSTGKWCFGDDENELDEYAWYFRNSGDNILTGDKNYNELIENNCKSHPVGEKKPNAFGLYDMHGNVWEWCLDWFDEKYYGQSTTYDPQGPWLGSSCVLRGGGWNCAALDCRSANRSRDVSDDRNDLLGFRVIAALKDE